MNNRTVRSEMNVAAEKVDGLLCKECPLLAVVEPTDNIMHELIEAVDRANKAIVVLNLGIKERDIEIVRLNNALDRHAMAAMQGNKYN